MVPEGRWCTFPIHDHHVQAYLDDCAYSCSNEGVIGFNQIEEATRSKNVVRVCSRLHLSTTRTHNLPGR